MSDNWGSDWEDDDAININNDDDELVLDNDVIDNNIEDNNINNNIEYDNINNNNDLNKSSLSLPESSTITRKKSYTILEPSNILNLQNNIINEVIDLLDINKDSAIILLRYYNWKKSKLLDEWLENNENVKIKTGIDKSILIRSISNTSDTYTCNICTDEIKFTYTYALKCNHRFCYDCWTNWVNAEMDKGPTVVLSVCPEHKCGEVLNDEVFHKFLPYNKYQKYIRYSIMSFVQVSSSLKFCPGNSCDRAVQYHTAGVSRDIECLCGSKFCFGCNKNAHRPATCDIACKWLEKNESDSENANWILANTKVCPKCKVPIEKNQGCNHMSCKMCKYEFCWLCKGDWKAHGSATGGNYKCNKFEEQKEVSDEQKLIDQAANLLQRYLHYFSRYDNHVKATKIAETQLVKTEARMRELQDIYGAGYNDVQFLLQAVKTVISCRQVLQWTYAYGFYLQDKTLQKSLFETYQEQLEKFTEHLHGLSEKPLEDLKEIKLRTEIINYTRVTERYRDNIVKAVESNFSEA